MEISHTQQQQQQLMVICFVLISHSHVSHDMISINLIFHNTDALFASGGSLSQNKVFDPNFPLPEKNRCPFFIIVS